MRLHRRVAVILGVAGCASPAGPPPAPGVAVEAALATGTAVGGEALPVGVTVRNSSATTYLVAGSAGGCVGVVEVADAQGRRAWFGDARVCDTAAARHALAPGAALTDRPQVAGVPPGEYRVRAGVLVVGRGLVWSPAVPLAVRSR
jgi:hypothetical protein